MSGNGAFIDQSLNFSMGIPLNHDSGIAGTEIRGGTDPISMSSLLESVLKIIDQPNGLVTVRPDNTNAPSEALEDQKLLIEVWCRHQDSYTEVVRASIKVDIEDLDTIKYCNNKRTLTFVMKNGEELIFSLSQSRVLENPRLDRPVSTKPTSVLVA